MGVSIDKPGGRAEDHEEVTGADGRQDSVGDIIRGLRERDIKLIKHLHLCFED